MNMRKRKNKKEQQQIKFYKKLLGKFIFLQATKNIKMFYFICPAGQVLKNITPLIINHLFYLLSCYSLNPVPYGNWQEYWFECSVS